MNHLDMGTEGLSERASRYKAPRAVSRAVRPSGWRPPIHVIRQSASKSVQVFICGAFLACNDDRKV
jgi:hypothetical protein